MSRPSSVSSRNLSLTEELERLEQSITLTLQEIDHNFSRAHQIVTTSILPVVQRYADSSKEVWEGSKFWKEFFEASANVSLSGYEDRQGLAEQAGKAEDEHDKDDDSQDVTVSEVFHDEGGQGDEAAEESYVDSTTLSTADQVTAVLESSLAFDDHPNEELKYEDHDGNVSAILNSPSLINSTPRPSTIQKPGNDKRNNRTKREAAKPTFADYPSPYEALKSEHQANLSSRPGIGTPQAPGSPRVTSKLPALSRTPGMSKEPRYDGGTGADGGRRAAEGGGGGGGGDVLLHRLLDKTYRIQATPHKTAATQIPRPGGGRVHGQYRILDRGGHQSTYHQSDHGSAMSSPDMAPPPQLNPDVFSPSTRRNLTRTTSTMSRHHQIRTPKQGVSVLHTPKARRHPPRALPITAGGGIGDEGDVSHLDDNDNEGEDDHDDESDEWSGIEGLSPPKTIQFVIPPSRLLRTPAKEASKRIVQDLLFTAGVNDDDTTDDLILERDQRHHHGHRVSCGDGGGGGDDDDDDGGNDDEDDGDGDQGELIEPTSPLLVRGRTSADMIEDTF